MKKEGGGVAWIIPINNFKLMINLQRPKRKKQKRRDANKGFPEINPLAQMFS